MANYRKLREKHPMIEMCRTPELAAEVTFQPIHRFNLDAAIIFADILLPLTPLGLDFEFVKGTGPVVHEPVRSPGHVRSLIEFDPSEELGYVLEALKLVRAELSEKTALIGFAGAPFTVASYMIEGGSSRHFLEAKRFMYQEEKSWHELMEKVSKMTAAYLKAQIGAGADAVQLFDSWVGCLSPDDYRRYVLPHNRLIFEALAPLRVPMIHFGTGASTLLEMQKEAGGTVIGLDWRIKIGDARKRLGNEVPVQGNLDPVALFAPKEALLKKVDEILQAVGCQAGHIFNLGHGILPQTPLESVEVVLDRVAEVSSKLHLQG
jgi:uroporphyrinogen decarboxylase